MDHLLARLTNMWLKCGSEQSMRNWPLSILLFRRTRPASLQTHGENRNSLVAFSGDPRYGTATERLPRVAVRKASNTGKITGWYRKLF